MSSSLSLFFWLAYASFYPIMAPKRKQNYDNTPSSPSPLRGAARNGAQTENPSPLRGEGRGGGDKRRSHKSTPHPAHEGAPSINSRPSAAALLPQGERGYVVNPESRWFGTKPVDPAQKTRAVLGVFSSVADNYDLMNDVMSMGIHRIWKDQFVRMVRPKPDMDIIDVAGGTGDIAFRMHRATNGQSRITVCDINPDMLRVGQDRAMDRGILRGINWVEGNAETLPFLDNSFDIYTIAFGLRNVTHIDTALADAYRVLKPGGRFFCLEFSHVPQATLNQIYQTYSDLMIPRLGEMIAGDRASYQYLIESIRKFPKQDDLSARLSAAGFDAVRYTNLTGGIAAIHVADKY